MKIKRDYVFFASLILFAILCSATPLFGYDVLKVNWGLAILILSFLAIVAFLFKFEEHSTNSKQIAVISMLGTLSSVSRVLFSAVPGIQPSTYIIICSGYVFGPTAGFMVAFITVMVSNIFLGHGPWTFFQMIMWGVVGVSSGFVRKLGFNFSKKKLIAFGVFWGYLFGCMMNLWYWIAFIYPLTVKTFMVVQINSLWFDTLHATGNAVFLGILGKKTIIILDRFRKRFDIEFID